MIAIQITQIENGWIVATPPNQQQIVQAARQQQQPQAQATFCHNVDEVCELLKEHMVVN